MSTERTKDQPDLMAALKASLARAKEAREGTTDDAPPECHGLCLTAAEIGVPVGGIAYAHPDCPLHNPRQIWSLPPEPGPEVTRVVDQYGQHFERQFNGQHGLEDEWIGQTFAGDGDVDDLVLEWPMLMCYHAPLSDATPQTKEAGE